MERINVMAAVEELLGRSTELSSGQLADRLGISRQSAHAWLSRLVDEGRLVRQGAGRGSRYRRSSPAFASGKWPRKGLGEDAVWREFEPAVKRRVRRENVISITRFAFTEMMNNAIDHSNAESVAARFVDTGAAISFEVEDDGIGIFAHVMRTRGLRSPFEAIAELQKGKVTTMPEAHTGQGIFFSSKMVDRLTIESDTTRWIIDSVKADQAVE